LPAGSVLVSFGKTTQTDQLAGERAMAKQKKSKPKQKSKASAKASKRAPRGASRTASRKAPRKAARKSPSKTRSSAAKSATKGSPKKAKKAATRRSAAAARKKSPARSSKRPAPEVTSKKPAGSQVTRPAAHRLPPAQRHSVEADEPRERAGDAEEKAFVGTDTQEDEAQELGEEFVRSVTSGEEAESEMEEEEAVEEEGGPFVQTSARTEYGFGTDESNPPDAEKSPFPQVSPRVSPTTDGEEEDQ
jgi:hypothetical protein